MGIRLRGALVRKVGNWAGYQEIVGAPGWASKAGDQDRVLGLEMKVKTGDQARGAQSERRVLNWGLH